MGLSNRAILDIVELIYYVPALVLCLWVIKKQGLHVAWAYLTALAIVRIVGAGSGVAADSNPSSSLIETSLICYSIGLSPLLLALLGIIKRINVGMRDHQFPSNFIQLIHLPVVAALALGIVGGIDLFASSTSSRNTGITLTEASIIIFLVSFVALAAITVVTFTHLRSVVDEEKRLLFAALASIPFLIVRLTYSIVANFDRSSTIFSITATQNTAVIVQAIMSLAMEFIVVSLYLVAGFTTPAVSKTVNPKDNHNGPVPTTQARYNSVHSRDTSLSNYPLNNA